MKAFWCGMAIVIGAAAVPLLGDFAAGLAAYDKHDYATAFKEWKPIAESGDAQAQLNLGLMYLDGTGVPQSFPDAIHWFRRAADQGQTQAQLNLGAMYGVGKGVKRDYIQAYKWLALCAASGDDKCTAQRDLVAKKLSASKLAEAQRQAKDWQPKKEQPAQ